MDFDFLPNGNDGHTLSVNHVFGRVIYFYRLTFRIATNNVTITYIGI